MTAPRLSVETSHVGFVQNRVDWAAAGFVDAQSS
jgi:hypothetical protein